MCPEFSGLTVRIPPFGDTLEVAGPPGDSGHKVASFVRKVS